MSLQSLSVRKSSLGLKLNNLPVEPIQYLATKGKQGVYVSDGSDNSRYLLTSRNTSLGTVRSLQLLSPGSINSLESFGTATLNLGAAVLTILPESILSAENFGSPTVRSSISIILNSINSLEAFGSSTIRSSIRLFPGSISSGEVFGLPDKHCSKWH